MGSKLMKSVAPQRIVVKATRAANCKRVIIGEKVELTLKSAF